jgi:signal transduction histidine kinase
VQAGVLAVTFLHLILEISPWSTSSFYEAVRHLPVVAYVIPVAFAGLRYGLEGGVLTGALATLLAAPNVVLAHRTGFDWVGELAVVVFVVAVGVVLGWVVERSERLIRRTQLAHVKAMTRAQEEERRRVARELHDEAQTLVVLSRGLDRLASEAKGSPAAHEAVGELRELAVSTIETIRRLGRELRPPMLDHLGLTPALEWLVGRTHLHSDLAIHLSVAGEARRLDGDAELTVFRVAQEALSNVVKHADAADVLLAIRFDTDGVTLIVTDDGCGFTVFAAPPSGSLGLIGMQERADLVGGRMGVESAPGQGTTVRLWVPA